MFDPENKIEMKVRTGKPGLNVLLTGFVLVFQW